MKIYTSFILFLLCLNQVFSQQIILDEKWNDWSSGAAAFLDKKGDGNGAGIDISDVKFSNDDNYLFIYVDVGSEINIQSKNNLTLFIDLDNNINTGIQRYGTGAEIVYNFGTRSGQYFRNSSIGTVLYHDDIGLITSPTVTSSIFEIGILRRFVLGSDVIKMDDQIRIILSDETVGGDKAPDINSYPYSMDNTKKFVPEVFTLSKERPEYLRIMAYNVLQDNLFKSSLQQNYRRIFQAIQPDIIGFCEIYNNTSQQTASLIQSFIPLSGNRPWYHAEVSPDIRIVSKFPIINSRAIDGNGAFLIDLGPTRLVYIVAHLPCCENEVLRQREVDNIMAFVRSIKFGISPFNIPQNTPVIIAGDMNLVGLRQQVQTFITGDIFYNNSFGPDFKPDWDDTDLEDCLPLTTNLPATFTWYNDFSTYSAGRLDYIFYTGSVMESKNSFALWSPLLTPAQLSGSGLFKNDIPFASDHMPVVCDFKIAGLLSPAESTDDSLPFSIQKDGNNIIIYTELTGKIQITDVLGRIIFQGNIDGNINGTIIDHEFSEGVIYIVTIVSNHKMYSLKIY